MSLSRERLSHNCFSNITRDGAVRIRLRMRGIVPLAMVHPSDTDVDTENHPFGFMFFRLVGDGINAESSKFVLPLCATEQAMHRLFHTLSPEDLFWIFNRNAHAYIAHIKFAGNAMNDETLVLCETKACMSKSMLTWYRIKA